MARLILSNFSFTSSSDYASGEEYAVVSPDLDIFGVQNVDHAINTLEGDDTIMATVSGGVGTRNALAFFQATAWSGSSLDMGSGNDRVIGRATSTVGEAYGVLNSYFSTMIMGNGNDQILGSADGLTKTFGVYNRLPGGVIDMGEGNDCIRGTAKSSSGEASGVLNSDSATINTGNGNDRITGLAEGSIAVGIYNEGGIIKTGNGDDRIRGEVYRGNGIGISGGTINTGSGCDRVIASSFGGDLALNMDTGNDYVKGFGSATVNGGSGWDRLVLPGKISDYNITLGSAELHEIEFMRKSDEVVMNTQQFERFTIGCRTFSFNQFL